MTDKTHEYELLIQETHLDTFGHVNHATYLQIFEEARWDLIDARRDWKDKFRETGHGPVMLEAHGKFRHGLSNWTRVVIRSQCVDHNEKRGKHHQRAFSLGEK